MIVSDSLGDLGFSLKKALRGASRSTARLVARLPGAKNSFLVRHEAGIQREWEKPVPAETLIDLPEDTARVDAASSPRAAGGDRQSPAGPNWKLIIGVGSAALIGAALLARRARRNPIRRGTHARG